MRISDWSSDVCSSDLEPRHVQSGFTLAPGSVEAVAFTGDLGVGPLLMAPQRDGDLTLLAAQNLQLNLDESGNYILEIGSASCRERVWQYVSFSVVVVSLKKKK